jgi:K+-sensing histidine kinase KdpD
MRHNLNAKRWCPNKSHGYLVAAFGVLIAFSLRYVLHPLLGGSLPLFFFQVNTIVIAYFFGIFPALLTLVLSAPLLIFFFMEPFGALSVVDQRDVTTLFVYLSYTVLTGVLVELLRREQYNAKMAVLISETRLKLMVEGDQKMRSVMRRSLDKDSSE